MTKDGFLPESGCEWLPEDAAVFLLAVAAACSPGEAVGVDDTQELKRLWELATDRKQDKD